jgi:hypothetical protein
MHERLQAFLHMAPSSYVAVDAIHHPPATGILDRDTALKRVQFVYFFLAGVDWFCGMEQGIKKGTRYNQRLAVSQSFKAEKRSAPLQSLGTDAGNDRRERVVTKEPG